jgi:undecaprenyl-diphosphatase
MAITPVLAAEESPPEGGLASDTTTEPCLDPPGSLDPGAEQSPFDDLAEEPPGSLPDPSSESLVLEPPPDKPYWRTNIFKRILHDQAFLVTKWWPSEFTRLSFTGPLVATTYVATRSSDDEHPTDFTFEQRIDTRTGKRADSVANVFTELGNGAPACAALGISYLLARHSGNDRLAEASSVSFEALVSTGIWVEVIKEVTARQRPVQDSHGEFFQYGKPETSSFPSGHSMGAFTVATVFAHVYSDKKWMPWVAYGSAAAVAWSRVALGRHFPSDVIAGAILGNSMGRMALARDGREGPLSPKNLQPIFDPKNKGLGVGYSYRW